MSGRPVHPQSDLEAQETFKKTLPGWRAATPQELAGRPVEIWSGGKTQLTDIPQIAVGFTFILLPFLSPDKAKPCAWKRTRRISSHRPVLC
jgi:hypothetical protein